MTDLDDIADRYDPHAVEERIKEHWETVDAYEQTVEHRADGENYFFVDGPPYTSGSAHMGHAWNKSLKDVYVRYHRMLGYDVTAKPGYDMHGLPIETRVEQNLELDTKKDIEEIGVENFIRECRQFAEESLDSLQEDFISLGVWMDWDDPYKTVDPEYMEAAWWGFKEAYESDLVARGKRSISQCPRCETAIANNEVEYDDVEDPSIYVKLPLTDRNGHLVVWTTTPWTLPANTFVAAAPDLTYVGVDARKDDEMERLYVAETVVEEVLSAGGYADYDVVETVTGEEMVSWTYEHPFADEVDHPSGEDAFEVYTADYVEADRTGLVHSAPGHGQEDFERGRELGLGSFCPVDSDGVFSEESGPFAGQFVRDANEDIVTDLDDRGMLLSHSTVMHSYGHCWRCDTPIIQLATEQWFITITDIKDDLLDAIEETDWYPQWARDNRFHNFVEKAPDWNVSRQRYWGIPIPIWLPEDWEGDLSNGIIIGDRQELAERVDQEINPDTVDLHKGTVDDLTITEDGTTYTRIPDVFDVWLDSSVATWGTLNYPEDADALGEYWPADLIIEAHDQTRGWFWSQLGMGLATMGGVPYKRVVMHGHALMPDGRAMSKSKDIRVDPSEVIEEYGVDPLRIFLLSIAARGEDMRFSWDRMEDIQHDLNIFWNVFRFSLPYMSLDDVDPATLSPSGEDLEFLDEWLLSQLQTVEEEVKAAMDDFRQDRAIEILLEFIVEDVSRYYIQTIRDRIWKSEDSPSKYAAYATLVQVLREFVAMLAPFAPHLTDKVYHVLSGDADYDTVHMVDWPEPDPDLKDPELETDVEYLRAIEEGGADARQQVGRKLRWPVQRIIVSAENKRMVETVERHRDFLAERMNAREVELIGLDEEWVNLRYAAEADMSKLGPALGSRAEEVMEALNAARVDKRDLDSLTEAVESEVGESANLDEEMIEYVRKPPEGVNRSEFAVDGDELGVIYVDATLTDDIESEGYAREVIRRVQEMRKELDLDIDERIVLELSVDDDRIASLVREYEDLIARETRTEEIGTIADGYRKTWDVEDVEVKLAIAPLAGAT